MINKNHLEYLKCHINSRPNIIILTIASLYLLPSLFLYFVSEDIKFAILFTDYTFFENLKNIWFPSGEFLNKGNLFRPIISSIKSSKI